MAPPAARIGVERAPGASTSGPARPARRPSTGAWRASRARARAAPPAACRQPHAHDAAVGQPRGQFALGERGRPACPSMSTTMRSASRSTSPSWCELKKTVRAGASARLDQLVERATVRPGRAPPWARRAAARRRRAASPPPGRAAASCRRSRCRRRALPAPLSEANFMHAIGRRRRARRAGGDRTRPPRVRSASRETTRAAAGTSTTAARRGVGAPAGPRGRAAPRRRSGRTRPAAALIDVVLPEPFGPSSATTLPAGTSSVSAFTAV